MAEVTSRRWSRGVVILAAAIALWGIGPGAVAEAGPTPSSSGPTVAIGDHHFAAVRTDGTVWTWGLNRSGQLGLTTNYGTDALVTTPTRVPGIAGAVAVAAGADFTVVQLGDGTVWTFGANDAGQLGTVPAGVGVTSATPRPVVGLGRVVAIAAGRAFVAAVTDDGSVWGFGSNSRGQLGAPLPAHPADPNPVPRPIVGLDDVVRIAAGTEHVVALTARGTVSTLGLNADGQLGRSTNFRSYVPNPLPEVVAEAGRVVAVAAGGQHTTVIALDGAAWTFGRNAYGELGTADDLFWRRFEPRRVAALGRAAATAMGPFHTVVADTNGVVRGVGGRVQRYTTEPLVFPALDAVVGVAAGPASTLALRADGSLWHIPFPAVVPPPAPEEVLDGVLLPPPRLTLAPEFQGFSPVRLLETRPAATPTIDGRFSNGGSLPAGSVTELAVTGRADIPPAALAVVLNVTVTEPQSDGYVTVYPCDGPRPNASNLNFIAGETIPNAVVAKLSAAGTVCVFTTAATQMTIDASGIHPRGSPYLPLIPSRLLETRRAATPTVDGRFSNGGALDRDSVTKLTVAGRGGVPPGARAAVLNVTVTEPERDGYVTLYPCDSRQPNASHLNFTTGRTIANAVIVKLSVTGTVCVATTAGTQMTVDVNGVHPADSGFVPLSPLRVFETRPNATPTIDGRFSNGGALAAGSTTELPVTRRGDVPGGVEAVVLNVTVVDARDSGYVTVYPCDAPRPNASNLNFTRGRTIPNAVIARPSASGTVCLFTTASVDMLVDLNGYQPV